MWSLAQAGVDFRELNELWFSHFHPDHVADLVPLLFAAKSPLYGRNKTLVLGGAEGLKDLYDKLRAVYGRWIELGPDLLAFREVGSDSPASLELPCGKLTTYGMAHTKESLGYRLETKTNIVVAYSGDTDYCANLVALARDADLFFCECSFPDELKMDGHLSPRWAGRVAREAGCKRLVLTHLYPACDETDLVAGCRREYSGEIVVAEDLMWFRI
jgi:ribonuclease BN (tRNA processing enzyme)